MAVNKLHDAIGEKTIADAVLDRLVHNVMRVELYGESIRKRKIVNKQQFFLEAFTNFA